MKRIPLIIICLVLIICLSGCSWVRKIIPIKEYEGTSLISLSYESVDYMGGISTTHVFDFENNVVTRIDFNPYNEQEEYTTVFVCEFTEEAEKKFIDSVSSYGLFNIKESYEASHTIMDGGGWTLEINYSDGSVKKSTGSNAGPDLVFSNCAIHFYDLCGYGVVASVPSSYYLPPRIDITTNYQAKLGNVTYYGSPYLDVERGNYLWNGHLKDDIDIYELVANKNKSSLLKGYEYSIVLYTANYSRPDDGYSNFSECVVMSYAIDTQLSDGKEVARYGWIDQVSIPMELDRIYVVTLKYRNGDFVEYAFSTASLNQKIQYGEYHYNIYNEGQSVLFVNEDRTFSLAPFDYIENRGAGKGDSTVRLSGVWDFETIDGKEYLVLTATTGERLVFEFCATAIYLDFDKTTLDIAKYNLTGEDTNGYVSYSFYQ